MCQRKPYVIGYAWHNSQVYAANASLVYSMSFAIKVSKV